MEADFSGYATKAGLKCSDGRTILAHAFQKQDKTTVPLVWQHGHSDVKNVLGHAVLENREDGVYAYGVFNESAEAKHAAGLLKNKDINMMSIWANQLVERSGTVIHGVIREVSLVLSGANPGALIDSVTIRHADGDDFIVEDEAIITTGLELSLEHSDIDASIDEEELVAQAEESEIEHADDKTDDSDAADDDGETIQDVYDAMTEKQKDVVHYMITEVTGGTDEADDKDDKLEQSDLVEEDDSIADASADAIEDPATDGTIDHTDMKEEKDMTNVFETNDTSAPAKTLSHDQLNEIVSMATKSGSLQGAIQDYSLQHGIENITVMFPDAQAVSSQPDWVKRRTEWVSSFLSGTKKSPFSKIKSLSADITEADARAKGYITGTLKREEYFSVARRTTEPTTVYKKQKLERDDMIDITEYNVVAWLQAEMRMMLEEEMASPPLLAPMG